MWPASLCTGGGTPALDQCCDLDSMPWSCCLLAAVVECKVQGADVACLPCQIWLARQACRSQDAAPVEGLPSRCCASAAAADGLAHSTADACIRPADHGSPGKCGWPAGPPTLQLWRAWHRWQGALPTCWTSTTMSSTKSWSWQVSCAPVQHALCSEGSNPCHLVHIADKAADRASLS